MIPERLAALRQKMAERQIDMYVVPTSDFHESEYVGAHFKAREFITGFTGSAGTAVITADKAGLWTDGRYFLQAEKQLAGTTVELYRMGEEDVPDVNAYIEQTLKQGGTLGFDGRVINGKWGAMLEKIVNSKHGSLYVEEDLIDQIWEDRPKLSKEPVWLPEKCYTGKVTGEKLAEVREEMKKNGAGVYIMTSLCDIAWLLNVRGHDVKYVPVVLSYLILTEKKCIWFLQEEALDHEVRAYLRENSITAESYEAFYEYVKNLRGQTIQLDRSSVNYRTCSLIDSSNTVMDQIDITTVMKSVKNPVEIANIRNVHVKDAVAMCKFMFWLKKNLGSIRMTELSVSDQLETFRRQQPGLLELSFETISGYNEHGAIVHYAVTPDTDVELKPEGLLLVDSGGHYLEGTTDITRTFVLGPLTEEMRADYTRVCRANLNLANARFLYGCTGRNLDILAREPLWEAGLDFKHGTGHGVGYVLNVHEGPNAFRWRKPADCRQDVVLEAGMITTDEPGLYIEGKYGIRLENELLCCKGEKNEYGQFMQFENLTYVPFELDALDPHQMTERERGYLNAYHENVYRIVSPYLETEEKEWLKKATQKI